MEETPVADAQLRAAVKEMKANRLHRWFRTGLAVVAFIVKLATSTHNH